MIQTRTKRQEIKTLMSRYAEKKLSIESSIALMSDGSKIPITFNVDEDFKGIPTEIVSGGVAKWRVFFADSVSGVVASQNSWRRGCVMVNHCHEGYDEFIYVIHGKLKDILTGEVIVPPEAAQNLHAGSEASEVLNSAQGWFKIPAGIDHLIAAVEDSEFVVKFVRI